MSLHAVNSRNQNTDTTVGTQNLVHLAPHYMSNSLIYQTGFTTTLNNNTVDKKTYIGLSEGQFKTRTVNHINTFRQREKSKATNLTCYIWAL